MNEQVSPKKTEHVCGINKDIVERFLEMIKYAYPKADQATGFMEKRGGLSSVPTMANIRDTLSHLVTALDPQLSDDERERQIANAEEHLRRAIIEPYQITVDDLLTKFSEFYGEYERKVFPMMHKHALLRDTPNRTAIESRLKEISDLSQKGREAKARNRMDAEWEAGIACFIIAFEKLTNLHSELKQHYHVCDGIRVGRKQTILTIVGIGLAMVFGVLSLVFIFEPRMVTTLRVFLGLE